MNSNDQRLTICAEDGKISLAKSLRRCPQCLQFQREAISLRKQLYHLTQQLQAHELHRSQMQELSQEIERTKDRLTRKLIEKERQMDHILALQSPHSRLKTDSLHSDPQRQTIYK
jgi:hypothetical protein